MPDTQRFPYRYRIEAWQSWAPTDPAYRGGADSIDAAAYIIGNLPYPLADVIDTRSGLVVESRRDLPHPALASVSPFVARARAGQLPGKVLA